MTTYIGWIPTVGRRLSYSIIGNSTHPSIAEIANVADDNKRRILCLQNRNLIDSAIPIFKSSLVKLFFNLSGSFVFFLDAECSNKFDDKNDYLTGKLYLFADDSEKDINGKILCIRDAINELNNYDNTNDMVIDDFYDLVSKNYLNNIDEFSIHIAHFTLDRSGIVEIEIDSDEPIEHIMCAQFFFFLKDISHRHQHHHPKTDTILDIYRKDNHHWQDEVLRSLYKKVLDFKRSRNEWVCSSALGVLCYIKAFKKICEDKSIKITVLRDDDDLSDSIKIAQDDLRHISQQKVGLRNVFITSLLAILGVLLMYSSLGAIAKPLIQISTSETLLKIIADNLINRPFKTLSIVIIVSMIISTFIYNNYLLGRINWFKDVARIFMCFRNQVYSGLFMILFAFLFAYTVLRMIYTF